MIKKVKIIDEMIEKVKQIVQTNNTYLNLTKFNIITKINEKN